MELICARHGRTAWNAERRFQGQTDVPLDAVGLAQARALAAHLRDERFDLVVASDLSRARTTAEYICAGREIAPELTAGLRERQFGAWEGLTWPEIERRWPAFNAGFENAARLYTPEGGESWADLCARIDGVLRAAATRVGPDGRVLVVSHAGVMHAIVHVLTGAGENTRGAGHKFVPAGILRLRGSFDAGWTLARVNEVAPPLPA
jgi:broad specificity phosphatase PhoE